MMEMLFRDQSVVTPLLAQCYEIMLGAFRAPIDAPVVIDTK
jgi:hypothetical protein